MFAYLFVMASLLTQAYLFRDTPSHPVDPCAADASLCPEYLVASLMAERTRTLERARLIALGKRLSGEDTLLASAAAASAEPANPPK